MLREPWRTRLLFVSVAGNLFAAALIGAQHAMRPPPRGEPRSEIMLERMSYEMEPVDRQQFRAVMLRRLPEFEAARSRVDEARTAVAMAIARTPYDEDAVRQAMKDWQDAWMAMTGDMGTSMLAAMSGLSPNGRRHLAEAGMRHQRP
jgi:uncharacterized membrane protein